MLAPFTHDIDSKLASSASVNFNFNFKLEAEIAFFSISPMNVGKILKMKRC